MLKFFLTLLLCFASSALADSQEVPTAEVAKQLSSLEYEAIKILSKEFSEVLEVRYLIESYNESEQSEKSIMFNAIIYYVELTLRPKIKEPSASQQKAFEDFNTLAKKHEELQHR